MGNISVILGTGYYPDLPMFLKSQENDFRHGMKSFFMLPFEQDDIQIFCKFTCYFTEKKIVAI